MGTWGPGAFENDRALDWVMRLTKSGAYELESAIAGVLARPDGDPGHLDDAIAAAITITGLQGKPLVDIPRELATWISIDWVPVPPALIADARRAIKKVIRDAPNDVEWNHAGDEAAWYGMLADLQKRLRELERSSEPPRSNRYLLCRRLWRS